MFYMYRMMKMTIGLLGSDKFRLSEKCRKSKAGIGEIKMNHEQRKKLKILKYANEENIKRIHQIYQ